MTKVIYDEQYFKDKDSLPVHLLMTLEEIVSKNGYRNILEVACGTGRLLNALKKGGRHVYGCDISHAAAKRASASVADVSKLPYRSGSFDLLIGISLIEHLNEKEGDIFLSEAKRLLRRGGALFLVTPNFSSPMRVLKGRKWFGYSDPTHVKFYNPQSLAYKLERNGFKGMEKTFSLSSYPDFNWGLPFNSPSLNRFCSRLLINSPLASFRDSFWMMGRRQ